MTKRKMRECLISIPIPICMILGGRTVGSGVVTAINE